MKRPCRLLAGHAASRMTRFQSTRSEPRVQVPRQRKRLPGGAHFMRMSHITRSMLTSYVRFGVVGLPADVEVVVLMLLFLLLRQLWLHW